MASGSKCPTGGRQQGEVEPVIIPGIGMPIDLWLQHRVALFRLGHS
jgi:hypothetical protein